ncbi:MAG: hypothetical protein JXQ66_01510 [Campylobacterales bacterium]|nr:hypothetical protein [Campylobacterales bacterium]
MVKCESFTRFSSLENLVILTQTDTTVGFLSKDDEKLYNAKKRQQSKQFLKVYKDFKSFTLLANRVPQTQKNLIRRSKKTTFIVKNKAFRVAKTTLNSKILDNLDWTYSTSANESSKSFDRDFCEERADIVIEDATRLRELQSSKLIKLNHKKIKRLR